MYLTYSLIPISSKFREKITYEFASYSNFPFAKLKTVNIKVGIDVMTKFVKDSQA
jgi:hypothetical protein